jgi:hypothetical protein
MTTMRTAARCSRSPVSRSARDGRERPSLCWMAALALGVCVIYGSGSPATAQTATESRAPFHGFAIGAVLAPTAEEIVGGVHFAWSYTPVFVGAASLSLETHLSYVETERLWAPLTWGPPPEPRPTMGWFYVLGVAANGSVPVAGGRTRPYLIGGVGAYRITGEMMDGPRDSWGYYPELSDGYGVLALNAGLGLTRPLSGRVSGWFAETRYHRGVPANERDGLLLVSGGFRLGGRRAAPPLDLRVEPSESTTTVRRRGAS